MTVAAAENFKHFDTNRLQSCHELHQDLLGSYDAFKLFAHSEDRRSVVLEAGSCSLTYCFNIFQFSTVVSTIALTSIISCFCIFFDGSPLALSALSQTSPRGSCWSSFKAAAVATRSSSTPLSCKTCLKSFKISSPSLVLPLIHSRSPSPSLCSFVGSLKKPEESFDFQTFLA